MSTSRTPGSSFFHRRGGAYLSRRLVILVLAATALPASAQAELVPPATVDGGAPTRAEASAPATPTPVVAPSGADAAQKDVGGWPALRVAVLDPTLSDIDPAVGRVVAAAVAQEVRKLERLTVISFDEVRALLSIEEQRAAMGCDEAMCLADIAGALGADVVVTITLSRVADQSIMGLNALDQEEARVLGRVTRRLTPAGGEEFLAATGGAVEELFPERPLREGQVRGVPKEVALRLNPPPLDPWVLYTTWAGAGAMVTAAGALLAVNVLAYQDLLGQAGASVDDPTQTLQKADIDAQFLLINLTLGFGLGALSLGAVLGVIGLVLIPLTDFEDATTE